MRALWLTRPQLTEQAGGDTTQILQTAAALRSLGCEVEITDADVDDPRAYDVVHLFHLERVWENVARCRRLRALAVPVALSPIYWRARAFDGYERPWLQRLVARRFGARVLRNLRVAHHRLAALPRTPRAALAGAWLSAGRAMREVIRHADVLLPNSEAERLQLEHDFGTDTPAVVVPNAADVECFHPPGAVDEAARAGVLCVGRIEPRKNQLALVRALAGTGIPLTLVGRPGPSSLAYHRRCLREAGNNVRWIEHAEGEELRRLYAGARVHASVSWYETPGLASLEAALCGCALVVTPGGSTREYFREEAVYCRPDDPAAIRTAVAEALARGPSSALGERVARRFSWRAAAERTLAGYHIAIQLGRRGGLPAGRGVRLGGLTAGPRLAG